MISSLLTPDILSSYNDKIYFFNHIDFLEKDFVIQPDFNIKSVSGLSVKLKDWNNYFSIIDNNQSFAILAIHSPGDKMKRFIVKLPNFTSFHDLYDFLYLSLNKLIIFK